MRTVSSRRFQNGTGIEVYSVFEEDNGDVFIECSMVGRAEPWTEILTVPVEARAWLAEALAPKGESPPAERKKFTVIDGGIGGTGTSA